MFGEDVDHARRETAVGNDGDVVCFRPLVKGLLLKHDLRIAAEVAEMDARVHRAHRHVVVEVVRKRAHHRVALAHQRAHRVRVANVERRWDESLARVRSQKWLDLGDANVGEPNFLDVTVLQEIVRAR